MRDVSMRHFLYVIMLAVAFGVHGLSANAAELVMYEADGCGWCKRWHAEIGVVYGKTQEGMTLPLRRVDADLDMPKDLAHVRGLIFTPTFVIVDKGREIGRIVGYPGEEFFWPMLSDVIAKNGLVPNAVAERPSPAGECQAAHC